LKNVELLPLGNEGRPTRTQKRERTIKQRRNKPVVKVTKKNQTSKAMKKARERGDLQRTHGTVFLGAFFPQKNPGLNTNLPMSEPARRANCAVPWKNTAGKGPPRKKFPGEVGG